MAEESNIGEIVAWVGQFVASFNFTRPGVDQSLGRDLCHEVAGQIAIRAATESRGADQGRWDPNERKYREWKARTYGWDEDKPNYRTGQMLSHASLLGTPAVDPDRVLMYYGTGEPPPGDTTWSPRDDRTRDDREADELVTDVDKAEWTTMGGKNRPARPFYQVDETIRDRVIEVAGEALADYLSQS